MRNDRSHHHLRFRCRAHRAHGSSAGSWQTHAAPHKFRREQGSVLVAVLWCMVILAVIGVGALHTSRLSLRAARFHGDHTRAYFLAVAGVERAKAIIYKTQQDLQSRELSYSEELQEMPDEFTEIPLGRGNFSVFHSSASSANGGERRYGLRAEDAFLNLNSCGLEDLKRVPEMDVNVAAAILDWRDSDNTPQPGGAEAESYSKLSDPYSIRNAPLLSPLELLQVSGVRASDCFGEDANGNHMLDSGERDGDLTFPPDNGDTFLDSGWYQYLTLQSGVRNIGPRGKACVNLRQATESDLAAIDGFTDEIAKAIVQSRDNISTVAHLLDVRARSDDANGNPNGNPNNNPSGQNDGSNNANGGTGNNAQNNSGNNNGEKLIDSSLLLRVAPYVSTRSETVITGLININLASREVLQSVDGMTESVVEAVLDKRNADGAFQSVAGLLEVEGFGENLLKRVYDRFCVRIDTFSFTSEGEIPSTGAKSRITCTLRFDGIEFTTSSYREDS